MIIALLIAHTFVVERIVAVQPERGGRASVLFLFRVPADKRGSVDAGWMQTALADVDLQVDGQPARCERKVQATAALWDCEAGTHWQLLIGAKVSTATAFSPKATDFVAAEPAPQSLQKEVRLVEWIAVSVAPATP